ncbi:MAG TPA: PQQ-binding-like beta-propeller repeat protein [Candidatus Binatia bacterium]|nr:PQQ-binding-like beta-propeller repeat protein [Candidatus Binatia bacterium]
MSSRILSLTLVYGLAVSSLSAANWTGWRGDNGLGISPERKVPLKWSATENVLWKIELPEAGNSTPVVWKDKVFITQAVGERRTVMCFDRKSAKLLWQNGTSYNEKEESHETNPYCSSSPVTDGERVIAWFGSAGVFCYDLTGKQLWRASPGKQEHMWGYASSPFIHDNLCILYFGPGNSGALVALNKKTGSEVWRVKDPPVQQRPRTDGFRGQERTGVICSFSSPILLAPEGRAPSSPQLIMTYPQLVRGYDPNTGKELWTCDGLNELLYTSPIAGDGIVVAMGGFNGSTIAVKADGKGDVTATHRLWRQERTKNRLGSGVVHEGHVYILNTEGIAECIELKTGKIVWQERVKGGATSESWSSMVLAADRLYVLNRSGATVVLKASPKFELLAVNPLDGALTNASHAISDGEIFIRTHKHLWRIAEATETAFLK